MKWLKSNSLNLLFLFFLITLFACSKQEKWYKAELNEETQYRYYSDSFASYKLSSVKSLDFNELYEYEQIEEVRLSKNTRTKSVKIYDVEEGDTILGRFSIQEFDIIGRLINERDSSSFGENKYQYEYLENGNSKESITRFIYESDYLNNEFVIISVDTSISNSESHYENEKLVSRTSIKLNKDMQRLSAFYIPTATVNSYLYTEFDSLKERFTIQNNDTISFSLHEYDTLRRKVRELSVDIELGNNVFSYTYDDQNNLIKKTWNSSYFNEVTLYTYNLDGQLISETVQSIDELF